MTFRGIFRCGVTMMTWLEIVRFELVYQLTRRSNWVIFAVFLFPVFGQTNGMLLEAGGGEVLFNGPLFVALKSVPLTIMALLVIAAIAGDAAARDVQTRMEPLMHASPVGRATYLGGRVVGAFAVVALLLLVVVPLVMMVASFLVDAELVGPFRPAVYLQSYVLLILPNAFVATAVLFALALLGRHLLGSYAGALLLVAGTFSGVYVGASLGGGISRGRSIRWVWSPSTTCRGPGRPSM